ncbi:aminotransferase class IV [Rubrolithibacter danxiaensis]|uniref:aminotransferase class IV n=1 Tax=Rubrolithibacter danxiaensis TaxID=3390805 RepID=UPI003BF8AC61
MPRQLINYNGEIFPADHPVLPVNNRAFRYGDGLFESMRVINGELKFADRHAERLQLGMKTLKLEGYSKIDAFFLREKVGDLLKRTQIGQNARVRLTVFREGDGLYTPVNNKFGYALEVSKIDEVIYTSNQKGLILDVYDEVTKPVNALSNLKTCNSLVYVLAGIFRVQNNLDEVFILNHHGFLCETMSSNVFVLYDKSLYTPALTEGCVAGVMRSVVMQLAQKSKIPVIEAQINPDILNEAEEVFITNSIKGIQWVMGYNNKRYFNEVTRFLLGKLNNSPK